MTLQKIKQKIEQRLAKRVAKKEVTDTGYEELYAKDGRRLTIVGEYINTQMGEGRYQDVLRRQIRRLKVVQLKAVDSTTIGDKYTHCSWGLCSEDPEQWPDPDDHIWPELFVQDQRIAPREHPSCPLDARLVMNDGKLAKSNHDDDNRSGCFYTCRVFQNKYKTPTADRVIELYKARLAAREDKHGKRTVDDDNENWAQDYKQTE